MPLKAILLDFDGVIAETDNHHIAAWQRTLSTLGWQIPDEVAARSAEIDDREFLAELFAERGIVSHKIEEWVLRKQVLTVQMLRDSPRLYPGVVELIRLLQGRAKLAVVSGTWRENIQAVLERRRPGRLLRDDRRQGGRDSRSSRPPKLTCSRSRSFGSLRGRRSPSKIRRRALHRPAQPEFASSPSAIAIPSATGWAIPCTSRDSNRSRGCCETWDCDVRRQAKISSTGHSPVRDRRKSVGLLTPHEDLCVAEASSARYLKIRDH